MSLSPGLIFRFIYSEYQRFLFFIKLRFSNGFPKWVKTRLNWVIWGILKKGDILKGESLRKTRDRQKNMEIMN